MVQRLSLQEAGAEGLLLLVAYQYRITQEMVETVHLIV
jgi:hypothetical protein